jgi:hypothetical protein
MCSSTYQALCESLLKRTSKRLFVKLENLSQLEKSRKQAVSMLTSSVGPPFRHFLLLTAESSTYIARVLRLLAANYIFVETEPGVFARNQCSSFLDTGKSVQALRDDPDNAYAETNGFAALIAHTTDDVLKASARAPDVLLDPNLGVSYAPEDAPFAAAFGGVTPFSYFAQNAPLMNRFGMAMGGMQKACSAPESSNTG